MKNLFFLIAAMVLVLSVAANNDSKNQTVEVLYFKAKQCACKTVTCNALEDQIKALIDKDFPGENIEFKRVWLNESENEALISKYNAKAQTVVLIKTKKSKETVTDLTEVVHKFSLSKNGEEFEKEMKSVIAENLK